MVDGAGAWSVKCGSPFGKTNSIMEEPKLQLAVNSATNWVKFTILPNSANQAMAITLDEQWLCCHPQPCICGHNPWNHCRAHDSQKSDGKSLVERRQTGPPTTVGCIRPLHPHASSSQRQHKRSALTCSFDGSSSSTRNSFDASAQGKERKTTRKETRATSNAPMRSAIGSSSSCPLANGASNQKSPTN